MKIVKSWKKNFKKTGALALATLVMCGSASFVRAENITLNQLGSKQSTIDGLGNQHAVYGYQTDKSKGYAANIIWGDMIFGYDNGTYDPKTGRLIATESLGANKVQGKAIYIKDEKDEDTEALAAGNWYGFDGENNAVKIENLSTGAVEITATPLSDGTNSENAEFNLYVFDAEQKTAFYSGSSLLADAATQKISVSHSGDLKYHGGGYMKCYYNNDESEVHRVFAAATFNDDGSLNESDKDAIYLNISGKPNEGLTTKTAGDALGTITLSFKVVDGEGTVGGPLTPVVPVVEQGNQG